MNTKLVTRSALSVIVIALAASACTPAAAQGEAKLPETGAAASAAQAAPAAGPLTEILNGALGLNVTPAEQQRQWDEQHRREEEQVARCMAQAGFEYFPNISTSAPDFEQMYRPADREWVAQYGFAVVNTPWETSAGESTDPNAAYLASLSPAELAAFNSALYGAMADMSYLGAEDMVDIEALLADSGCWGAAQQQTVENSAAATFYTAEFAPLTDAIMAFFANLTSEVTDADHEWVTCMANAGHSGFQRQSDAAASINAAYDEFMGRFNWDAWDADAFGYPSAAKNAELAKLSEQETGLALADFDCRVSTDFDARRNAFQVAAEKQFVADHAAELNAVQAAVEQR